jgi:hypothetical protein
VAAARAWILQQLEAERGRWMLWLPVAMGLGIAVYFELPNEPAIWLGPGLAAAASAAVSMAPSGSHARALCIGLAAAAAGLGLATWRTANLAAPTLSRPLFSINVEGRVADIQRLPESIQVVLEAVRLKGNGAPVPEMTPARLRVSLSKGAPPLHVGDRILVLANLSPPSGPAAPDAFDFQRVAWYQELGAVGYALAPAAVIDHGRPDGIVRFIDGLRGDITACILKALPGPEGGAADRRADRRRQGYQSGHARFGAGAHPVDLGPAHRVRDRAGDGNAALWHRTGAGGGVAHRRQEDGRRDRASGGAFLHRSFRRSSAGAALLCHGGFCATGGVTRPHRALAQALWRGRRSSC